MDLHPDQLHARQLLYNALRGGHKRIILKLPTGGGKTVMAADMAESCLRQGKRMCFCVDAISLIDQTVEKFAQAGVHDVGVIQANHPGTDYSKPIQVASIQTLARRKVLDYQHFDIVLVDEAHCQYSMINEWMGRWKNIPFVGLTATPYAKGMAEHWETLVAGGTIRELIEAGRLSPYKIFAASHPDLEGVRTKRGDWDETELSKQMQAGALVGDTVKHWMEHADGRPTLAFCVDRTHAKYVQQTFEESGIRCGYVDAYTEREERQVIADQFHAGDLQVVSSVGCLTKGVDWDVRCILLLRPTKSEMLYLQIIGRGLRTAPGKDYCLILDHSDTVMRLGFPEDVDERNTELDDGTRLQAGDRDEDEPMPKPCSACGFVKPPKTHACPSCGFAPEKQHQAEEFDAEMEELIPPSKVKINRETTPEQKGLFYAGLKYMAAEGGKSKGWAAHRYREKFGVWPNKYDEVDPQPPTEEVRNWVKRCNIAYARRKKAA